jgi:hypothetical protein
MHRCPIVLALGFLGMTTAEAAKLVEVRPVDDEHLMIHWLDSKVHYQDNGKGKGAFMGHETKGYEDRLEVYGRPLDTAAATSPASFTLVSPDDPGFAVPVTPTKAFRRSKVGGTPWKWPEPEYAMEHTVFLRLPRKLQQGKRYRLQISSATQSDATERTLTFDVFRNVSEAVHVNIVGYNPAHTAMKSADLYMWLGDGGARDYSDYVGRRVMLVDSKSGRRHDVGRVAFWKPSGPDYGGWNLTRSPVWNVDFSPFTGTGTFRLVVEGVGCSPEFKIRPDVYFEPFKTSVRGFYYMRIGEPATKKPVPRQPRFIPGKDPEGFTVFLTNYGPWHPDWKVGGGDKWDTKDWAKYRLPGNPTNPNAYGGHSDALDWDRHAGHISIIWDLLLPYVLTGGKPGDDNLDIRESGNGIPDLIDEAQNEVDFWLRLRDDKGGYGTGLNNPTDDHKTMYQAQSRPYMAWANALNAAMLADAFRIAGRRDLVKRYRDAAIEAWNVAGGEDLDEKYTIGNGMTRGRDLKMMAAAFLYNVTGDRKFEDAMAGESVVKGPTSFLEEKDAYNQLWGTVAYLMCAKTKLRPIHHPQLLANMRASVIHEAKEKHLTNSAKWPSRRSSDTAYGWFQSTQEVQRVIVAHAISSSPSEREALLRALILEADWGLGRNPMNMVQMTGLGSRHADDIYTSGQNDGTPGVHPGHTPYMNSEPWGTGFMADPRWYASKGYPAWEQWPQGEALWPARYSYSNNEFTPQQTMRGKQALYAYLYALGASRSGM